MTREEIRVDDLEDILKRSTDAFASYQKVPLDERIAIADGFLDGLKANKSVLAKELSVQMGRPIRYCPIEIDTTIKRGRYLINIAKQQLGDIDVEKTTVPIQGAKRKIKRKPVGVVLAICKENTILEII